MFSDRQATAKVATLSGGERNRLLLAKLFAQSHNLMILDEPTNDLDVETLDLLQEEVSDYDGTVLLVSHDRDFLDRTVTSIIAVEGEGRIREYVGGYQDYLAERRRTDTPADASATRADKPKSGPEKPRNRTAKMSYKDGRELELLPDRIAKLDAEIATLGDDLADATLFNRDPKSFETKSARLVAAQEELAAAEDRWLELEAMREDLAG
ncbi:MAG: ATP-binding cassette domain-containing protein [Thalassobaculum sp.]